MIAGRWYVQLAFEHLYNIFKFYIVSAHSFFIFFCNLVLIN